MPTATDVTTSNAVTQAVQSFLFPLDIIEDSANPSCRDSYLFGRALSGQQTSGPDVKIVPEDPSGEDVVESMAALAAVIGAGARGVTTERDARAWRKGPGLSSAVLQYPDVLRRWP